MGENIASKDTENCNHICGKNTLVVEQWLNEVLTLQVLPLEICRTVGKLKGKNGLVEVRLRRDRCLGQLLIGLKPKWVHSTIKM